MKFYMIAYLYNLLFLDYNANTLPTMIQPKPGAEVMALLDDKKNQEYMKWN